MSSLRSRTKEVLARLPDHAPARGTTILIWHRVGGGTDDELDLSENAFDSQLDELSAANVVSLDSAIDRLERGDDVPTVVLTFDDGFAEVHSRAFPRLRERELPFTIYLAAGFVGAPMRWEGSTGEGSSTAVGLSWAALAEMVASGLCTVGNHTFNHVRPEVLDEEELDRCSDAIEAHLGQRPRHFAFPWGVDVPSMRDALATRFRTAVTGDVGRNAPGADLLTLRRVPVRRTDPMSFFAAKLHGSLRPERTYARLVGTVKHLRPRG